MPGKEHISDFLLLFGLHMLVILGHILGNDLAQNLRSIVAGYHFIPPGVEL